jgi:multiple sugar transport system ATP-binding protein
MKDGLIQQADTPLVTYNHPTNRFVAGFIGMPPMNFFDGALKMIDGQLTFEEGKLENARVAEGAATTAGNGDGKTASDEPVVMIGELTLPGKGFRLPVPSHLAQKLNGLVGKHVVLGVRPEHFHLQPMGGEGDCCPVTVQLNVIEPLGNDMDVYMSTSLHDYVVGRVEAQTGLQMNTQATVYVDLRKVHFFEPGVTGMNLSLAKEPAHALA